MGLASPKSLKWQVTIAEMDLTKVKVSKYSVINRFELKMFLFDNCSTVSMYPPTNAYKINI